MNYATPAHPESVSKTIAGLKANNIHAEVLSTKEQALERIHALIPEGAEVMTMTSVTIDSLGISRELNESGKYTSVRATLNKMDRKTQSAEMQKLGAAPEYAIGSVHAVTEDGQVVIASNTGSQLPAYAYGSQHVIWVVGTQKIVSNLDEAMKRIYDYVLPLEADRARKAYGVEGSNVSKVLIVNKEVVPNRITLLFVPEAIGF